MRFRYIASYPDGRVVEDNIDARDNAEVLKFLAANNLKPVSIKRLEKKGIVIFGHRISLTDQIFISKYLALMLKIGTGLLEAINILIVDFHKPAVKNMLLEIRSSLERGNPFYSTFARYPKIWGPVYINMVKAGEASGNLEKIFQDLTETLSRKKELIDQIRGALMYPILLFIGSISIIFFLVIFALPKISKVFLEGGIKPPVFSAVVFAIGAFLNKNLIFILIFLVMAVTAFIFLYRFSLVFKRFISSLVGEIPVIKNVLKKIAIQRFASTLSSLIRAGMPLTEALEITALTVGNMDLKDALVRISREGLAKGLTVGDAFRKEIFFPKTVVNLVAISEKAGHLEEVLETLSDFYVKEIDVGVKTLVAFLEPVLLVFIGAIIGIIALSVITPIYQLTTQF